MKKIALILLGASAVGAITAGVMAYRSYKGVKAVLADVDKSKEELEEMAADTESYPDGEETVLDIDGVSMTIGDALAQTKPAKVIMSLRKCIAPICLTLVTIILGAASAVAFGKAGDGSEEEVPDEDWEPIVLAESSDGSAVDVNGDTWVKE